MIQSVERGNTIIAGTYIPPVQPFEPYTYYRTPDNSRVFTLLACEWHPLFNLDRVILLEWGKPRTEAAYMTVATMQDNVTKGKLLQFTPTLK